MFKIRPFEFSDISAVKQLTDHCIGKDYYKVAELENMQLQSLAEGINASLVLEIDEKIQGIRLSFPAKAWEKGKGMGLCETLWPYKKDETAYFQSLFINPQYTHQGFGKKMSIESIKILRKMGAKGIVCHAWKESPNDSSRKYLHSLDFEVICEHPHYWKNVDYVCPRCSKPCLCTAVEMYLDLEKK